MKLRISRALGPAAMATAVALALLVTAAAYAVLPGYDAIALAYVDHPLPIRRIAFGSFIAYALSHSLGFPLLSGGPVRYRFWSIWGLSTSEIAQAISFAGATFTYTVIPFASHSLRSLIIAGPMIEHEIDRMIVGG